MVIQPSVLLLYGCFLATAMAPAPCPSACFCDDAGDYVSCVGDGLWEVPADIPPTVTRLELRYYVIGTLSADDLHNLDRLIELKLQQTQIQHIANETFENLTRLERLDLSQNILENLTVATFAGLSNLRYLDLSANQLNNILEAFTDLVNVEQLNLRENLIPELTSNTFTGLTKVQYLNLDSNQISSIEVGTFQYLNNLAHLILSNNPLTTLTRLDFFGSRLQYIDVSHVGLQKVPQSLTRFVRDLRLAKNNLTQIRLGDFDSYPYLGLLVLDDNMITDIQDDALGRQEYLQRLWLNGNQLRKVPTNLPLSLRTLYIEENQLEVLPSYSFRGLANIEQLFLQRNRLRELKACAFCDLISLKSLDLQANFIENLTDGVFANLSKLETLDLSMNPLKVLGAGSFNGLEILKTLQLSRMKSNIQFDESIFVPLKKLEIFEMYDSSIFAHQVMNTTRALHSLRNLRELNIMHNNLVNLRADFPNFFPQLKVIKMSGNNWYCDRSILWLTTWIKRSDIQFYRSYSIRCGSPEDLQYKPIMMLSEEDFPMPLTTTTARTVVTTTTTTVRLPPPTTITVTENTTIKSIANTSKIPNTVNFTKNSSGVTVIQVKSNVSIVNVTIPTTVASEIENATLSFPPTRTATTSPPTTKLTAATTPSDKISNITLTIHIEIPPTHTPVVQTSKPQVTTLPFLVATHPSKSNISNSTALNLPFHHATSKEKRPSSSPTQVGHTMPTAMDHSHRHTVVVTAACVAAGLGLVLLGLTLSFLAYRCRKSSPGSGSLHCQVRRSSSISYYPQRDEVSIVTVSEGTVGLQTATHNGLGNKLYFVMENGEASCDLTQEALPDPDLRELLPQSVKENGISHRYIT